MELSKCPNAGKKEKLCHSHTEKEPGIAENHKLSTYQQHQASVKLARFTQGCINRTISPHRLLLSA